MTCTAIEVKNIEDGCKVLSNALEFKGSTISCLYLRWLYLGSLLTRWSADLLVRNQLHCWMRISFVQFQNDLILSSKYKEDSRTDTSLVVVLGDTLPDTDTRLIHSIWHCPLTFKQRLYFNSYQQHQEFPSSLPSKYCLDPMMLDLGVLMETSIANSDTRCWYNK